MLARVARGDLLDLDEGGELSTRGGACRTNGVDGADGVRNCKGSSISAHTIDYFVGSRVDR